MQEVKVKHSGEIIQLGRQGENLARRAVFDLTNWQALYGEGVAELICQRPGEDSVYPVAITQDGPAAIWEITDTDTTRPGVGHCELRYYVDETLAKSETWMTKITKAMEGDLVTPPAPGQSWADQVLQAGAAAVEAAEKAESAAVRQPIVGDNGNWWIWDPEAGAYADTGIYSGGDAPYIGANGNWYGGQTDTGVAAAGPVGPPGPQGPQGPAGPALAVTNTAAVGQIIKVSAVDENGQPTEWEAVDIPTVDDTLTQIGQAADAAAVGEQLSNLSEEIANIPSGGSGLTTAEKTAMLTLFKAAAYTSDISATISDLETLWSGTEEPDEPDVSQTGNILFIVSGVTASQSGSILAIA